MLLKEYSRNIEERRENVVFMCYSENPMDRDKKLIPVVQYG
jgi:hypothetical protein